MSTTPPANIILAEDNIVERAHPLDDSYENNASDHRGTPTVALNILLSSSTKLMRMPFISTTTLPPLLLPNH
jgi:hypothetical protein